MVKLIYDIFSRITDVCSSRLFPDNRRKENQKIKYENTNLNDLLLIKSAHVSLTCIYFSLALLPVISLFFIIMACWTILEIAFQSLGPCDTTSHIPWKLAIRILKIISIFSRNDPFIELFSETTSTVFSSMHQYYPLNSRFSVIYWLIYFIFF